MGWRLPPSCSMDAGSRSWGSGGAVLPEGDLTGGCWGLPPPSVAPTVCSFSSPPNPPTAFTADREPCSGCRACPSPATALSLPARVSRPVSCQESLPHPFDLQPGGVRGHSGPCRGAERQDCSPGGLWHLGTPPWAMNLGTRGCHAQCQPAWVGDAKPVLPPKVGHFFFGIS